MVENIINEPILSKVMVKNPPPNRHKDIQFQLAWYLKQYANDVDVRIDFKPYGKAPRVQIYYTDSQNSAAIMLRLIRQTSTMKIKDRAWNNFLKDITKLETLYSKRDVKEAYCLLFTNDLQYKQRYIDTPHNIRLLTFTNPQNGSDIFCKICEIHTKPKYHKFRIHDESLSSAIIETELTSTPPIIEKVPPVRVDISSSKCIHSGCRESCKSCKVQ